MYRDVQVQALHIAGRGVAPNALHLAATRTSMLPGYSGTVGPLCRTDQPGALTTTVHADVTCPDCRADAIGLGVVG
jgi:hypothetical protein